MPKRDCVMCGCCKGLRIFPNRLQGDDTTVALCDSVETCKAGLLCLSQGIPGEALPTSPSHFREVSSAPSLHKHSPGAVIATYPKYVNIEKERVLYQ